MDRYLFDGKFYDSFSDALDAHDDALARFHDAHELGALTLPQLVRVVKARVGDVIGPIVVVDVDDFDELGGAA